MLKAKKPLKKISALLLAGLFCLLVSVPVLAASKASVTQSVTQGYGSDTPLQNGMIVKLEDKDANKVEAVTTSTIDKIQGVVVAANDAAVTLSDDANKGQVFVATFGRYDTLVSNQNGPIAVGDYITVSSIAGIGMKAGSSEPVVLGKAAGGFDGTSNVVGTSTLTDTLGKHQGVSIGLIPVDVVVARNPLQRDTADNLPGFLRKVSESIANKPVSTARVYISLAVLLVSAFVAGGMLYAGIRGGLISIGRNPLAKKTIGRSIAQVIISSIIVFIIGVCGVYLLLKL